MGILNVTPDSFSDGGRYTSAEAILRRAGEMIAAGADLIDIGGESSRPYATAVSAEEELHRVLPAITLIRQHFPVPISIDTTKAVVARAAIAAGADLVNDISALRFDPELVTVVKESGVPLILMHMQGSPGVMQKNPTYSDVVAETLAFLAERVAFCVAQGIERGQLIVDPGLGFGKTVAHNLSLIKHLEAFQALGCPILIGHSRKSFIGKILGREEEERDVATAALSALSVLHGAQIIRVHDVAKSAQAIKMAEAVIAAP